MQYIRSATATIVTLGPFIGSSDGYTIKNSLGSTAELVTFSVDSNTGGAPTLVLDNAAATTGNGSNDLLPITNCDAGLYQLELTTANTNYVGRGMIVVLNTTHLPVFEPVTILPQNVYDALIQGSTADLLDVSLVQIAGSTVSTTSAQLGVNAVQLGGTAQTGRDVGASVLLSSGTGAGEVNLSSGVPYVLLSSGTGVGQVILSTGYLSADLVKIAGSTVSTTAAQLGVNAVQVGGTAQTTGDLAALLVDIETKVDDLEGRTPPLAVTNGTVVADGANSVSQFMTDLTPTVADYYKDCLVLFTDGDLAGQVKEITSYTTDKIISVSTAAFTSEPTTGAAFSIINR